MWGDSCSCWSHGLVQGGGRGLWGQHTGRLAGGHLHGWGWLLDKTHRVEGLNAIKINNKTTLEKAK